ncbi:MAG: hypothetical protein L6282_03060 [Candidatus Methanoperedenaceae archaeon]|nr:hypothetical protein [Candidatus Methanoperedenaceae archaeon]
MLETPEERVKLLKAGISAKDIEKLYIIYNEFKIVNSHILYESNDHSLKHSINHNHKYRKNAIEVKFKNVPLNSCYH